MSNTDSEKDVITEEPEKNTDQEASPSSDLEKKIEELTEENKKLTDQNIRALADIQNIKRRSFSDSSRARKEGALSFLRPLMATLDDYSRAFSHIPDDLSENEFIQSLKKIDSALCTSLEENGVTFFAEKGDSFDPQYHESMMLDDKVEDGLLAEIFEKGVSLNGEVVRHAKVTVGSKK